MKKLLSLIAVCLSLSVALGAVQKAIIVDLTVYRNDSVVINGVTVSQGSASISGEGPYSLSLMAGDSVISSFSFNVSFTQQLTALPPDFEVNESDIADVNESSTRPNEGDLNLTVGEGELVEFNESSLIIVLPYYHYASSVTVSKDSFLLIDYPVSFCNQDGVCDPSENFFSCYWDCPSGGSDGLCDEAFDHLCDPDCTAQERSDRDPDCTCGNDVCDARENGINCPNDCGAPVNDLLNLFYMVIGGGIALIAGVIVLIVCLVKRRKKKSKKKSKKRKKK